MIMAMESWQLTVLLHHVVVLSRQCCVRVISMHVFSYPDFWKTVLRFLRRWLIWSVHPTVLVADQRGNWEVNVVFLASEGTIQESIHAMQEL